MDISWNGLSCFDIRAKTLSGNVNIVIDPYRNTTGLRFPRGLHAEVVIQSHDEDDANNVAAVGGEPYIIDMPGEYEVKSVFVFGIGASLKRAGKGGLPVPNMISRIEVEGIKIVHLGALDRALTDDEFQKLDNTDILMIPVGGGRVMDPKAAAEVISQIEPRVVVPMTHALPSMKEKLGSVETFCKAFGVCRRESMNKYKVKRKDLPEDDMLIVTLSK